MTAKTETDILVAGAGIAGMIAALVFSRQGLRVTCVDPSPASNALAPDLRSTAFLMPSIEILQQAGVFDGLASIAAPLKTMRIVDAGGEEPHARQTVDFDAAEAGEAQFGWNIPNAPLRQNLAEQIASDDNIVMLHGDAVEALFLRTGSAVARLASGLSITSHLVVAADGRDSSIREMVGIGATTIRYGQKALVFQVSHLGPHNGISTEVHRSGGPFTLVPLAGDDQTRSAVVWMVDGAEADRLMNLSDAQFDEALNYRSGNVMGRLTLSGKRAAWPIISRYADRLTAQRVALVGEAAHVVPPIGAQGLNMSLADIACLRDLISDISDRPEIGSDKVLETYHRKRWPDMRIRVTGIDALNRASQTSVQPLKDMRAGIISILGNTPALKRHAITAGLGR